VAQHQPDAPAAVDAITGCWSYGELRRAAGRVAALLARHGVKAEQSEARMVIYGKISMDLLWFSSWCFCTCIYIYTHTVTTFKYVEGGPDRKAPEVV